MPSASLKGMAKRAGISYKKAERYWKEAKQSAKKQGIHKKDDEDRYYTYVMGIVTRRMKYKKVQAFLLDDMHSSETALFNQSYPLEWKFHFGMDKALKAFFQTKDKRQSRRCHSVYSKRKKTRLP